MSFQRFAIGRDLAVDDIEGFGENADLGCDLRAMLFARLRGPFTDAEILDLTLCCAVFVGLGRTLEVLQITEAVERDL